MESGKYSFEKVKSRRRGWTAKSLHELQRQLRLRRQHLIGSDISLCNIVCENDKINEGTANALSQHLASLTVPFWNGPDALPEELCSRFYLLAIYMIAGGEIGEESVDDIIQLADCLVLSRETFINVCKKLLPDNMIGEMFSFIDSYDNSFFFPYFSQAVLGAISAFLGALDVPTKAFEEKEA